MQCCILFRLNFVDGKLIDIGRNGLTVDMFDVNDVWYNLVVDCERRSLHLITSKSMQRNPTIAFIEIRHLSRLHLYYIIIE